MLSQESITALSHAPTAPASIECDLLAGTESVIEEIQQRLLAGQSVNNRALTEIAERAYGGSRARGTYTARDAYDATETAVNKLLATKASELMTMSVSDALSQTLRPLTERLPRQSDRTREQVQFQQLWRAPDYVESWRRAFTGWLFHVVSSPHNQSLARNAIRESSARKRCPFEATGDSLLSACSLVVKSAST